MEHFFRLCALLLLAGCGPTEYVVHGTDMAAGTDGEVVIEEIDGENHMVSVELRFLPPPDRVEAGHAYYCLWIVPASGPAQMASVLEYDEDDRVGTARVTTPVHRFEVKVTAERTRTPGTPSEHVVIRQRVAHE